MKTYLKIFAITFLVTSVVAVSIVSCVMLTYNGFKNEAVSMVEPEFFEEIIAENLEAGNEESLDPFIKMIKESKRINILMMGIADNLADSLVLISYDPDLKSFDLISIPRDTYYEREGYTNRADYKKINAAHTVKENKVQSTMNAVSNLLGIPIHNYIRLDYQAVAKMVDAVGGITVNVKEDMYYHDPYATPPLLISFSKGLTTLNGKDAIKYIRYREPLRADLGRIDRQQQFINTFIKKAMGLNLLKVVNVAKDHLETNIDFTEALVYAREFIKTGKAEGNNHVVPGKGERIGSTDYFIHDPIKTRELIEKLYKN